MAAAARRFGTIINTFNAYKNGAGIYLCTTQSSKWKISMRRVVTGLCIAAGGIAVCQHCSMKGVDKTRMIHAIPVVFAREKTKITADDEEMAMSAHEHRFRLFSSVEYEGQLYMTPLDFIESVTMSEPKKKKFWRALTRQDLDKILSDTPPVWKGSSRLFRNLNEKGIISYTEYLFLLCILTKPQAGFKIAFNMFDADGNEMVDKREFMVLEEIFRKKNDKRGGETDSSSQVALKKEQQRFEPKSFWDVLKHGARIVLFSDLVEHVQENIADTTLLVHFFGKKGKTELNFEDFYRFMDNLQTEVLEIEFLAYSKGMTTISEEDFARILLRYTTVDNISSYLENVHRSIPDEKGITFEEFRSFFQFLNNLEDFAIAMQMYNYASRPIGQDEFARAVYVATGLKLSKHLVNIVFKIFDVDHDDQLSYKEFIGIMKDRLHRGSWGYRGEERFTSFKACMKKELSAK
ncbi:calcium uptake protein 3, mitochondrial isoform X2 [Hemibagrus wyckioides]|uniref:calcium uptake protein 3, mitochondrial isoform X2 n=1 Tax=Hemibagrus wyckioides TaxID=337641 RepID=UPI00266C6841|nr:calcium uptake protein 3, mitochondrial isoform X2 [Hemibagrus wyckioides]